MKKINEKIGNKFSENELILNYKESQKDKNFKSLVDKLDLSDTTLMKYTTSLEQSVLELKNCTKCKNLFECNNPVKGHAYLPKVEDNYLTFSYKKCRYKKKADKQNAHWENIYFFEVPKEIKEAKMSDVYVEYNQRTETVEWIINFIQNYEQNQELKGLFLHGNFGTGKTYLISAMFNELAQKNIKSSVIYWPEFLRDIKGSFQSDFSEKINKIKKTPLLLIDDLGAESVTEWNRDEILGPILQYRMQDKLPTFITSNLNIKEMEEHLSITKKSVDEIKAKRIIERIKHLTHDIEMISSNLR